MLSKKIVEELWEIVGKENVITDPIVLEVYGIDASPYSSIPKAVIFPENTEQIIKLVKLASREDLPIIPRGAGTSLCGGVVPVKSDIILVLTKMKEVIEINKKDGYAVVEPGLTNGELQEILKPYGFMFAPDPSSFSVSTIGGNVGANAGGIKGVKYGVTSNHLLGLEVVMPDGELIKTGILSPNYGVEHDITGLFCGSEGTFGIITKIAVKLTPLPQSIGTLLTFFTSLHDAGQAVSDIIAEGIIPTTLEIMDKITAKAVNEYINLGLRPETEALLLIEVDGLEAEIPGTLARIERILHKNNCISVSKAQTPEERELLWRARRSNAGAMGRIRPLNITQDIVVPRDKLPEMISTTQEIAKKFNVLIGQVAHAGDGNVHPIFLYYPWDHDELERVEKACDEVIKLAIDLGGTISGEHGIGIEKLKYMSWEFSPEDLNFMKQIKECLDPKGILNAGKVIP
ncbi:FAD-binding oxidoreductase [Carboxydothermus hydrogenoformans]|uniref:Glycolate oxidase, GlcD subunit n=1 Tax=Carboxydothermus hydrogenoformans (strain ATCC BAA-161 / DSM 6008 / Z-2901) TaxID=246194 RepID=Q3ACK3_CARHZ|nr:FAD-linked oxidase C-terminal domain-containing protein [Carboxydothermus hydrogenoformans]ABB13653.1 glycolate oxidase, GlcD subunit [Carboxydothermus hydrogenoformans Z-2901]